MLYARDADERRPIASTTKLMTALLTMEKAKLADKIAASDYIAAPIESKLSLRPGERLSVADLLRGLMLESANDAAMALADGVGGSEPKFVRMMNRHARKLGLDEHALREPDRARRARQLLLRARPRQARGRPARAELHPQDREPHLGDADHGRPAAQHPQPQHAAGEGSRGSTALKTGHTSSAGYVLVGTRTARGVTLVSVVLGTPSLAARDADSLALLKWGAGKMEKIEPVTEGELVGAARDPLPARRDDEPDHQRLGRAGRPHRREDHDGRRRRPDTVTGPVARGSEFGYREVFADGKRIAAVPIVAEHFVPAADVAQRTKDWFTRPLALILAVAVLGGTVLMARRCAAAHRGRRALGARAA